VYYNEGNMAAATLALPATIDRTKAANPWLIAITVTLATFMELLDTAIANVSLPHIAGGFATSYDEATLSPCVYRSSVV